MEMSFLNVLIYSVIISLAFGSGADELVVQVANGKMRGVKQVGDDGTAINSFLSIPYAKPPVGPLRFRAPEPAEDWDGVLDATKYGPICIQSKINGQDGKLIESIQKEYMDEDCLTLDVYVPAQSKDKSRAVMVWIHGGGFAVGYGQLPDGENLAANYSLLKTGDVILVGMNYRLGMFGFLSTGDESSRGNWGLRDQSLALAWVKTNIAAFGGDPQRVTIFGISAGGVSVNAQLMSPYSNNLFNRAIAQSGAMANIMMNLDPLADATRLARKVNCSESPTDKLVECLRQLPAQGLLDAANIFDFNPDEPLVFYKFTPVIDGDFLIEGPPVMERNIAEKELMVGFIDMEGYVIPLNQMVSNLPEDFMTVRPSISESDFDQAMSTFAQFLQTNNPAEYGKPTDLCLQSTIAEAMKFAYTDWDNVGDGYKRLDMVVKLWGDTYFGIPAIRVAKNRDASNGTASTYLYYLKYKSTSEKLKEFLFYAPNWIDKATHGEDAYYMFSSDLSLYDDKDRRVSEDMITYWTNFARTGNPNKPSLRLGMDTWETYNSESKKYLEFGETPSTKITTAELGPEYYYFWTEYLPKLIESVDCQQESDDPLFIKYLKDNIVYVLIVTPVALLLINYLMNMLFFSR